MWSAEQKIDKAIDRFHWGTKKSKIPDSMFDNHNLPCPKTNGSFLNVEVAYRIETYVELLWEGSQILSETINCLHCLLVKIEEIEDGADMLAIRTQKYTLHNK